MARTGKARFVFHKTAHAGAFFKKPKGFEKWFFTGPSLDWGHVKVEKRKK